MKPEAEGFRMIQSVVRATSIMEYIAANCDCETLSSISRGIGLSKTTTYSLIRTLEQLGYVQQDQSTGKYSLGLKLFELGQVVHSRMDLRTIARPYLIELARKYEETVHLAVLSKGEVVYIDKVDGSRSIRIASQVGGRNPAYCTGVGKVLLAGLPAVELDKIISARKLERYTAKTIIEPGLLKEHLQEVRTKGYAMDQEEIEEGLHCVAAPIKNHRGVAVAGISLSGPTQRLATSGVQQITDDLIETARLISSQLGYKG
ncbi:MAG: IclR family transcriptional regulator [Negativicutes bacterium]|nr:IclR family transcriptional regulator [Negativicutes bacterium]